MSTTVKLIVWQNATCCCSTRFAQFHSALCVCVQRFAHAYCKKKKNKKIVQTAHFRPTWNESIRTERHRNINYERKPLEIGSFVITTILWFKLFLLNFTWSHRKLKFNMSSLLFFSFGFFVLTAQINCGNATVVHMISAPWIGLKTRFPGYD